MGEPEIEHPILPPSRPRLSVDEMLAAKNTQSIGSMDDLRADTFETDDELDEFLAFVHEQRQRDAA